MRRKKRYETNNFVNFGDEDVQTETISNAQLNMQKQLNRLGLKS